jgi:hypothetical protein
MAWLSDLAQALGPTVGWGTTIAVALYYGAIAAENEARPEALKEISEILRNRSWRIGGQPNKFIPKLFCLTFGDKQLSPQCVFRSICASVTFVVSLCALSMFFEKTNEHIYDIPLRNLRDNGVVDWSWGVAYFLPLIVTVTIIPDYISIAKARLIVSKIANSDLSLVVCGLVFLDIFLSIIIAAVAMTIWGMMSRCSGSIISCVGSSFEVSYETLYFIFERANGRAYGSSDSELFIVSTLLTSVWAIIALLSSIVVKALLLAEYTRKFTTWFFNIEKHPIRAVGIVSGVVVFGVSLMITLLRAV